jgi:predicted  nucleic acid-binding Zn-ribbon protein
LDPIEFLEKRPVDQVDAVLELAGVAPPVDRVAAIAGERLPVRDGESASTYLERLSRDETGDYYIRRREAHRACIQKEAAMQEGRKSLEVLGGPLGEKERIVSAVDLMSQIDELREIQDKRNVLSTAAAEASRELQRAQEKLDDLKNRKADKIKAIDAARTELQRLERDCAELNSRIVKGAEVVAELRTEEEMATGAAAQVPMDGETEAKIDELRKQVHKCEQANSFVHKRQLAQEQLQRLGGEYEGAIAEHAKLDTILAKLRDLRAHLLDDVDLGVPGLSIGDGGLRLNDVPFIQASTAEKLTISCAMAFRQNPRLKLCRVDNAEHLDAEHRNLLLNLATANGWQVIMATVSNAADLQVEIIEPVPGEVVDAEFEAAGDESSQDGPPPASAAAMKEDLFGNYGDNAGPYKEGV